MCGVDEYYKRKEKEEIEMNQVEEKKKKNCKFFLSKRLLT
jgi:hypothetical protein